MAQRKLTGKELVGLREELETITAGLALEPIINRLRVTGNHGTGNCRCPKTTQEQCLEVGPRCRRQRQTVFPPTP